MKKRTAGLLLMALLYMAAGINHFLNPGIYLRIMPPYIPFHKTMVALSGVAECVCGALLLYPKTRRIAAWCIIILLIAVFPANVQMCINYYQQHQPGFYITILRLPLQLVLIAWAYQYCKQPPGGQGKVYPTS